MNKFGPVGLKWLKIMHLILVVIWVGGLACFIALSFVIPYLGSNELLGAYISIKFIDVLLIIPGALGNVIIGLVYGIWTNWGFFKYKWIVVKWIVSILQILFGSNFQRFWIDNNIQMLKSGEELVLNNAEFLNNLSMLRISGIIQFIFFVFLIIISVMKPWKIRNRNL